MGHTSLHVVESWMTFRCGRLLRKMDFSILPVLVIVYLFDALDR